MDFGQSKNLEGIPWKLPDDDPSNRDLLSNKRDLDDNTSKLKVFVGCPIWANAKWLGSLYPQGASKQNFLTIYSENFSTVEYNGSFYHLPTIDQVQQWKEKSSEGFRFCPKVPQEVSHRQNISLELIEDTIKVFQKFEDHLGLPFLQLPPTVRIQDGELLKNIVEQFKNQVSLSIELRHSSWLEGGILHPRVRDYFIFKNLSPVFLDTPGRRDLVHSTLTNKKALVRFLASENKEIDRLRLKDWCHKINQWRELGLKELFFILHEPDDTYAPSLADTFIQSCNEICKTEIPRPRLQHQLDLF